MIRLSKLADYGIVLLSHVAARPHEVCTTRDLAKISGLPLPTVSKVMKSLCRGGLVQSQRGVKGGYLLAKAAQDISVVDMIAAIDGPIAITECSTAQVGACELETACPVRSNWQRINHVVVRALSGLTLEHMKVPVHTSSLPAAAASDSTHVAFAQNQRTSP